MNTIGLIAGSGRFPFLISEEIRRCGDRVYAVALREETDPDLETRVDGIEWISVGQFQKLIDIFHREGVTTAVMVGKVQHASLFAGFKLDWRAVKLLGRIANKKTDSILGAVAEELSREGIQLLPSHQHLKHLLPAAGLLCGSRLSREEKADIEFGFPIAKQIAGLDIGQTIAVKDRAVIAVEAMEGTDECIKRAALLGREHIVVVKVSKPSQDWRFDIPVIGTGTVVLLARVKARVLAVEAGSTLLLDRDELLKAAEANRITIVAV